MANISMKKKKQKAIAGPKKHSMLPPVVPQSAKNGNQTMMDVDNTKSYSLSKTMIIGNRSISAGKA